MSKPKIEAIYPLTFMQQALLLHSLYEKEDQGFLQVKCTLCGRLDISLLKQVWQETLLRHTALRTSIHWEKIDKPVQVVHPQADLAWSVHDWRDLSPADQMEKLAVFRQSDRDEGIDLQKAPVSRLALLQLQPDEYILLWTCHHILFDGWSAAVILRDVFQYYEAASKGQSAKLETLPPYRSYLNWLQQQDLQKAEQFWKQVFQGFDRPTLIGQKQSADQAFKTHTFAISPEATQSIQEYGKNQRLTLNTIVQGLWAILISRYQKRRDVAFGTTVSGRSADLPNIDLMAGLFMNVLPVRTQLTADGDLPTWFQELQKTQMQARVFEHISLDQILSWLNWSGSSALFDSLLVFENFPWNDLKASEVILKDFAGGLTSTYPLTIVVKPGDELSFLLYYNAEQLSKNLVEEIANNLESLINLLPGTSGDSLNELLNKISVSNALDTSLSPLTYRKEKEARFFFSTPTEIAYVAPQNHIELQLTKIWEEIFGRHPIGVKDNFFEIGGSSLLAVQLFAKIERQLGRNLSPVMLLQHPTIESLAPILHDEENHADWSSIVPIRASGSRPPLFCVHAGGAHIFFYNAMAHHLGPEQPVYAIQPKGLDGELAVHNSIEEMAHEYLEGIRNIQPEGPYALLGTCFSNAVCFEMAKQLQEMGQSISLLTIIDSPVRYLDLESPPTIWEKVQRIPGRVQRLVQRFRKDYREAISKMISAKRNVVRDLLDNNFYALKNKQAQNLMRVQHNLEEIYVQYDWKPFQGKITLIRSRHVHEKEAEKYHITQWQELALEGLEVYVVEGSHHTLFEEPEVEGLTRQLKKSLEAAQKE